MEKRITGIYFTVLLIGIIYAIYASASFHPITNDRTEDKGVLVWDEHMEKFNEEGIYYYKGILPVENTNNKLIVFQTVHMYLEVFIDGNKVYELKTEEGNHVKTTGFCWNIISLTKDDAGKEILFKVTPIYRESKPQDTFYYGTYPEIVHKVLSERIIRLVIAITIMLSGIVMLLYGLFVVKKGQEAETIVQFAIFATMLGIWCIGETQILDWIFPCNILLVFISHLMLMSMPLPFLLFLRHMYHNKESRLWNICCYTNCAIIAVRVILQITGMYDLRETLLLTHIHLLFLVIVVAVITSREIAVYKFAGQVRVNSICVFLILISVVLELAIYRLGNIKTPLGSIGFLIYIIVMGIANVRISRKLMEQARESALYRKLAYTDALTGLSNRAAFKEEMEKRMESDKASGREIILPTIVFMFDLNDLKKCNDTYGHDYGDQYIKMAADVLNKIFGQEGKCYRIGGDEFCAWLPYTSMEKIHEKLSLLDQEVQKLNDKGFVVTVSIAAGYAIYDEESDGSGLYSTMKRADQMMYEKKQQYKKLYQN